MQIMNFQYHFCSETEEKSRVADLGSSTSSPCIEELHEALVGKNLVDCITEATSKKFKISIYKYVKDF